MPIDTVRHTWTDAETVRLLQRLEHLSPTERLDFFPPPGLRTNKARCHIERVICCTVLQDTEWFRRMELDGFVRRNNRGVPGPTALWKASGNPVYNRFKWIEQTALEIRRRLGSASSPRQLPINSSAYNVWMDYQSNREYTWYFLYVRLKIESDPGWLRDSNSSASTPRRPLSERITSTSNVPSTRAQNGSSRDTTPLRSISSPRPFTPPLDVSQPLSRSTSRDQLSRGHVRPTSSDNRRPSSRASTPSTERRHNPAHRQHHTLPEKPNVIRPGSKLKEAREASSSTPSLSAAQRPPVLSTAEQPSSSAAPSRARSADEDPRDPKRPRTIPPQSRQAAGTSTNLANRIGDVIPVVGPDTDSDAETEMSTDPSSDIVFIESRPAPARPASSSSPCKLDAPHIPLPKTTRSRVPTPPLPGSTFNEQENLLKLSSSMFSGPFMNKTASSDTSSDSESSDDGRPPPAVRPSSPVSEHIGAISLQFDASMFADPSIRSHRLDELRQRMGRSPVENARNIERIVRASTVESTLDDPRYSPLVITDGHLPTHHEEDNPRTAERIPCPTDGGTSSSTIVAESALVSGSPQSAEAEDSSEDMDIESASTPGPDDAPGSPNSGITEFFDIIMGDEDSNGSWEILDNPPSDTASIQAPKNVSRPDRGVTVKGSATPPTHPPHNEEYIPPTPPTPAGGFRPLTPPLPIRRLPAPATETGRAHASSTSRIPPARTDENFVGEVNKVVPTTTPAQKGLTSSTGLTPLLDDLAFPSLDVSRSAISSCSKSISSESPLRPTSRQSPERPPLKPPAAPVERGEQAKLPASVPGGLRIALPAQSASVVPKQATGSHSLGSWFSLTASETSPAVPDRARASPQTWPGTTGESTRSLAIQVVDHHSPEKPARDFSKVVVGVAGFRPSDTTSENSPVSALGITSSSAVSTSPAGSQAHNETQTSTEHPTRILLPRSEPLCCPPPSKGHAICPSRNQPKDSTADAVRHDDPTPPALSANNMKDTVRPTAKMPLRDVHDSTVRMASSMIKMLLLELRNHPSKCLIGTTVYLQLHLVPFGKALVDLVEMMGGILVDLASSTSLTSRSLPESSSGERRVHRRFLVYDPNGSAPPTTDDLAGATKVSLGQLIDTVMELRMRELDPDSA